MIQEELGNSVLASFINSTISGNSGTFGVGVTNVGDTATFTNSIVAKSTDDGSGHDIHNSLIKISAREREVLYLIAFECTSKQIAEQLYISYNTALSHRKHLMEKLHVKNTAGLVRRAFELGFLLLSNQQSTTHQSND